MDVEEPLNTWRPNLSSSALTYLHSLGIGDAESNKVSATLVWMHALAIGNSPLYVEQNGEAVRSNWPHIPLPGSTEALRESAALGARVAALLNPDQPFNGVDTPALKPLMLGVAAIERVDGTPLNPDKGDLAVTAGWGIVQTNAVMPGAGRYQLRERVAAENDGLTDEDCDVLGEQVLDIYLSEHVRWRGVPAAVWDYKIGGFQVLRKWLSYRDKRVLGRDLTVAETRAFASIARRLTAILLLGPKLDANYLEAAESTSLSKGSDSEGES